MLHFDANANQRYVNMPFLLRPLFTSKGLFLFTISILLSTLILVECVEPNQAEAKAHIIQASTHVDNPYAGAKWYINPDWAAEVTRAAAAKGGTLGAEMAQVSHYSTAVWLDRIAAVTGGSGVKRTLTGYLDNALLQAQGSSQPVVITIVVYDLPNRDCAALASNGELSIANNGLKTYESKYIDPIATALSQSKYSQLRIAAIVEPDSLPNLVTNTSIQKCAEAKSSNAYELGVQYALNKLHAIPNVYNYIDLSHSGWLGWDSNFQPAVNLITSVVKGATAGVNSVDGFISNTANYTPVTEPFMTAKQMVGGQPARSAKFYQYNQYIDESSFDLAMYNAFVSAGFPSSIGMLIDTSRDGWGGPNRPKAASTSTDLEAFVNASRIDRRFHRGNWCNQSGGIGARPVANPAPHFDAYVWIKPPGESDGTSNSAQNKPDAEGKQFDAMCDPTANNRYDPSVKTGSLPNAPDAGHWFESEFETLVQNAYPPIQGSGSPPTALDAHPVPTKTKTKHKNKPKPKPKPKPKLKPKLKPTPTSIPTRRVPA
jgi:cellulose 1,4-beta-cellobiosidase